MVHPRVVAEDVVNPGYVLKVEPTPFPDRLDVACERKGET